MSVMVSESACLHLGVGKGVEGAVEQAAIVIGFGVCNLKRHTG